MGSNQHQVGRVYDLCVYFRTGNPKGLTESGSGDLGIIVCGRGRQTGRAWDGTQDPWVQRGRVTIPLYHF